MHPTIHIFSFIGIISLMIGSLTGCGEKRVNVASIAGYPSEEIPLEPIDTTSEAPISELPDTSLDEPDLSTEVPTPKIVVVEPSTSLPPVIPNEPINMAHAPITPSIEDEPIHSPRSDSPSFNPEPEFTKEVPDVTDNDGSLPPLTEGQDVATQSNSSLSSLEEEEDASVTSANAIDMKEDVRQSLIEPSSVPLDSGFTQDSSVSQDLTVELEDSISEENLESLPDTFQIARAQPSDRLQDQMERLKKEEFSAAAAALEDVFFPFDSWTLTKEGKHSLKNTGKWLKHDFSSILIIEGHSDQRGTQAYNMILGKRRALAVRDYLSKLGIDPSHLITISYGKDKPFCQDITEVCHQLNRRGHLFVQNP